MGTVHLARAHDGAICAIKVVHPHLLAAPGYVTRFLREAAIGEKVRHPHVVRTLGAGTTERDGATAHYLVMEYVEGQTLRELLDEMGRVPESLAREIGLQIARGVAAIHAAGVIHHDLRPENVMITRDHTVKVMDLGVAQLANEAMRQSQQGEFVGSIFYAAPEKWTTDGAPDVRADLYSLGIVLHELVTGQRPDWRGTDPALVRSADTPATDTLSPFYRALVHSLIAPDPEDRLPTASAVADALAEGEDSSWWQARLQAHHAPRSLPVGRPSAFRGREPELERLFRAFEEAQDGQGRVVWIEGEAGIGKTRLVDEMVARLRAGGEGFHFLFGSYPATGIATASGVFSEALREFIGPDRFECHLARHLGTAPALVPAFAAQLRGDPPPDGAEPLTIESMQTAFLRVMRAIAAERPTILLIDDLHRAPDVGRALFCALAHGIGDARVLMLGTSRRGMPSDWAASLRCLDRFRTIRIPRLPRAVVRTVLADVFQSERLADDLGERVADRTDGNPFFIFELIEDLRRRGLLHRDKQGVWSAAAHVRHIPVPATVQELIRARIAQVEPESRGMLELAACCGFAFDPTLVAEAAAAPILSVLRQCGRIETEHRLIHADGAVYRFDHHHVHDIIYASLAVPLRREYHAMLGTALACRLDGEPRGSTAVELCRHFLRGDRAQEVRPYLLPALRHLAKRFLHQSALRLADRVLAESGLLAGSDRLDVLRQKIAALDMLSRRDHERAALDEALDLVGDLDDDGAAAAVFNMYGNHLFCRARYDEARSWLRRARDRAAAAGTTREEIRSEQLLGNICYRLGDPHDARRHYERGITLARMQGSEWWEAGSTVNLGMTYASIGAYEDAERLYGEGIELACASGHRRAEAFGCSSLGRVLMLLGRYGESLEYARRFKRLSHETGDVRGELAASAALATVLGYCGALDEVSATLAHAQRLVQAHNDPFHIAYIVQTQAWVAEQRGDLKRAEALYREALELRRGLADDEGNALSMFELGRVLLERGDREGALQWHNRTIELADRAGTEDSVVSALCYRALIEPEHLPEARARLEHPHTPLSDPAQRESCFVLWRAGGDRTHLVCAHRSLDGLMERVPSYYRRMALHNVTLHRAIAAAWQSSPTHGA